MGALWRQKWSSRNRKTKNWKRNCKKLRRYRPGTVIKVMLDDVVFWICLSIFVSYVLVSSCLRFRWEVLELKKPQHCIVNVLEGRSGEEKTRNRRVAEQVAGSFCYAGPEIFFCTMASDCLNLVSNIWERFHCVFFFGWFFVQDFKQVLFPVVLLIGPTMGCACDKF